MISRARRAGADCIVGSGALGSRKLSRRRRAASVGDYPMTCNYIPVCPDRAHAVPVRRASTSAIA